MDPSTLEWLNQITPSAAVVIAVAMWAWRTRPTKNGKNGKNGNGVATYGSHVTLHLDEESKRFMAAILSRLDAIHMNTHDTARAVDRMGKGN